MIQDSRKIEYLKRMVSLAGEMRKTLRKNKINSFGELLDENWKLKKKMADSISLPQIDKWYAIAQKHGAFGGKLLGAGGGGFLLFYAPENKHRSISEALPKLKPTKISFEPQGSKIIFVGE